ncbi:GNAT family N-acetyltransferase [Microbacterium lushaniae]|nr:GNAT family N-acetyltransferase [Microbacterium lushaniae]KAA9159676.1 GNAT family N-acetyltransferase [Microbacterium lushaniae]
MIDTPLSARVHAPERLPAPQHPEAPVWRGATAEDIDAVHALFAAAGLVDHPTYTVPREEIADHFTLPHIDPSRDTILAFGADGELVAASNAILHPSRDTVAKVILEGTVHPDRRRRGIGTVALAWAYDRALQHLGSIPAPIPGEVAMYAEERTTDAAAIAERIGLSTERWFTTMVRDLDDPVPERAAPARTRLVPYAPERAMDVLAARNDAFRDHWGSLPSVEATWRAFVDGPYLRPDLSSLLVEGDRVVALCLASVNEDDWAALGEPNTYIDLIGVVRDRRGRGYAPTVIARTLAAARDAGLRKAVLDVDTASPTGALGLYERLGFAATDRSRVLTRHF